MRDVPAPDDAWLDALSTVAEIVATVDLERALGELGRSPEAAADAAEDALLGARVLVLDVGPDRVALAEPSTEGRLAATLARHDEGSAGRYVALPDGDDLEAFGRRAAARDAAVSEVVVGPFGPSVLVLGRPPTGPHVIVVERPSLPSGR